MYYVYVGRLNDEILYIGKGKGARDSHLNSGCSSVYEANKLHFSGGTLDVERVVENLCEPDALELEAHLINEVTPAWNRSGSVNTYKKRSSTSKYLGVSFYKSNQAKPWRAWYKSSNLKHHIGYYKTEVEAASARDDYLLRNGITGRVNIQAA
ncbi:hypothetical protein D3C75_549070 [compost metagenome]